MDKFLTPEHLGVVIRLILRIGFILLSGLMYGCHSMRLSSAAAEAGVARRLKDASPVVGTFENMSAERWGPGYKRLWDLLSESEGLWGPPAKGGSDYGDHVRISEAGPGVLDVALLSHGKAKQTARMPYSVHGNYLHLRHHSRFNWLPLGFSHGNSDLAITGNPNGDLIALYRYEFFGVARIVGNAGDAGTVEFRFPRLGGDRGSIHPPAR
jgi:hypothetical protein